jgi:hypothetical protein
MSALVNRSRSQTHFLLLKLELTSKTRLNSPYLQVPQTDHESPQFPLLRGKRFDLLFPGELADTLAHCLYCGRKIINTNTRLRHINTEHGAEHMG